MDTSDLLDRDTFRESVFKRDGNRCVMCGVSGQLDAHHIMERRLWTEPAEFGGYFLDNGASLCSVHHIQAEETTITPATLREKAGIEPVLLPGHLYRDQEYDKWGNPVLPNGTRLKGELFYDESVQKIIGQGGVLGLFVKYVKYPRTYHLPWSSPSSDDRVLSALEQFAGKEVVVTEKLDGENTTLYNDYIHARSLEKASGADRAEVWKTWTKVAYEIPEGWRVCGENLLIKHSIHYKGLKAYFQVFSIWNERNVCLSWDETVEWAQLLGLQTVPVLYRGEWDEEKVRSLYVPNRAPDLMEGYVVRNSSAFNYGTFRNNVAKFVRPNHVNTDSHWRHSRWEKNKLWQE